MKRFNNINHSRFNHTIKTLALGAVVAMTCSCDDFLTIYPTDKVILENYWSEKADVENMVANSYASMLSNSFVENILVWGEVRSESFIGTTDLKGDLKNINDANLLSSNGYCNWSQFYYIINNCNIVMKYAPEVMEKDPNYTEGDYKVTKGEMLAIRALCHFYLVRTFRNIPLLTEAMIDDSQDLYQPQVTPLEALDQIYNDLKEAEFLVLESDAYPSMANNRGRITRDAVRAMIADVLLWKAAFQSYESDSDCSSYYTECIAYCDEIINSRMAYIEEQKENSGASLDGEEETLEYPLNTIKVDSKGEPDGIYYNPAYTNVFYLGNDEVEGIFEINFGSSIDDANYMVPAIFGYDGKTGPFSASSYMAQKGELYIEKDFRRASFVCLSQDMETLPIAKYTTTYLEDLKTFLYSYKTTTVNQKEGHGRKDQRYSPNQNFIIYRMADVMLMKAEALAYRRNDSIENDGVKAFEMVKAVWDRSNPAAKAVDTIQYKSSIIDLQNLVLEERHRELAFEGKRWYDLVRRALYEKSTAGILDIFVNRKYTSGGEAIKSKIPGIDYLFFPIAEREINTNPLLVQNPAYEKEDFFNKN